MACESGNIEIVDFILTQDWFNKIDPHFPATGAQIAAEFGHIELIQYFFSKFGDQVFQRYESGKDIWCCAAKHGDWNKFLLLVNTYHQFFPATYGPDKDSPLGFALSEGRLYFAQQFVLKYGPENLGDNEYSAAMCSINSAAGDWLKVKWTNTKMQQISHANMCWKMAIKLFVTKIH